MASTQDAIAAEEAPLRRQRNKRLRQAVHRHKAVTRQGIQERLFTLAFSGLVYPQIWEDPVVDLEALSLKEGERLVAIASGGCNVLSYLAAAPISVTAIDLNPAHVALNKLKLAALAHLPDYAAFRTFFADANRQQNIEAYFDYLRPHLDAATRNYWESRDRIGRTPHRLLRLQRLSPRPARQLHRRRASPGARARQEPAPPAGGEDAQRAAPHLRQRAGAAVPQAPHPLAARQAVGAVRPRHPAVAVHGAEGR